MNTWVIRCRNDPSMYWSNSMGWVGHRKSATVFSDKERDRFNLPMEGYWEMMFKKEK